MKTTMKKLFALLLVCCMILCSFTAAMAEPAEEEDVFAGHPEDFADWSTADISQYLIACGVWGDESMLMIDMSENDYAAMSADAGVMYVDFQNGTIMDIVIKFDTSKEESAAMVESIKEYQAIVVDGDVENGLIMDAMIGSFCFSYMNGLDDAHLQLLTDALSALAEHFEIEPDFLVTLEDFEA